MSNLLLYIVTILVWGSTWIAIEFQLGVVAPEVSVFYRYTVASGILFAWCAVKGLRLSFGRSAHVAFALLGLLLFSLNYVLTYHAQQYISSALTAIIFSTMLWLNILNSRIFFGVRAGRAVAAGSVLGITGIAVLFLPEVENLDLTDTALLGCALAFSGAFLASLGNMVSQAAQKNQLPIIQSNAWGMFYGTVLTGLAILVSGQEFNIDSSAPYLFSLIYLAVFGSIIGFGAYLTLLGRIGAHRAGYAMVTFPVVAIVISVVTDEIELTLNVIAGVTLVIAGNLFVLRSRQKDAEEPLPARSRNAGRRRIQRVKNREAA